MATVLKIEESKIVTKNNVEVQRVIFSDDKIVYVRLDNGHVYPKTTPDKYVDLINIYNASHDDIDSTKPKRSSLWDDDHISHIKDGTADRQKQIDSSKNKSKLSKNRDTQTAINRIISFGNWMLLGGIIQIVAMAIIVTATMTNTIKNPTLGIVAAINLVIGFIYAYNGSVISKLKTGPSSIRTTAIVILIISIISLLSGALGVIGLITFIYSIIALTKVGTYEEWYYGEIE